MLDAVADGRLHLSAVCLLASYLTGDTVDRLVAAASHRSKREVELLLAAHAPRHDLPERLDAIFTPAATLTDTQLAPGRVGLLESPSTRTTPLAPQRFALQVTISQITRDKLERAQALLRHRVPSGDLAQVVDLALDALLARVTKEKFGATQRPARGDRSRLSEGRRVRAEVKRAVHERDGEQCSFVSDDGQRCLERGFLELDHVEPVALGGSSTEPNVRILCAAHNQYEAERRFGRDFVAARRRRARGKGAARRVGSARRRVQDVESSRDRDARDAVVTRVAAATTALAIQFDADVMLALRGLGVTLTDAREALARSAQPAFGTLEERLRAALAALRTTYASRCSEPARSWSTQAA